MIAALLASISVAGCDRLDRQPASSICVVLEATVCDTAIRQTLELVSIDRPGVYVTAAGPACPPSARCVRPPPGAAEIVVMIRYDDGVSDTFEIRGGGADIEMRRGEVVPYLAEMIPE